MHLVEQLVVLLPADAKLPRRLGSCGFASDDNPLVQVDVPFRRSVFVGNPEGSVRGSTYC